MKRLSFMLATLAATAALHAAPQVDVVATGLNNPRGLAFAPNGQLFVAEAGSGGNGRCLVLADGRSACYGETVASVSGDGAYDTKGCHEAIAQLGAQAIIPTRKNAKPWKD